MAAGLLRPLPRWPVPAQALDPRLLLWTRGPDRAPRPVIPGCPLAGQAGTLLPAQTGLFLEEEDEAAGAQACCLPSLLTPPPGILSRGWAGPLSPPRPQKEDAAPFQALPRDCVLHSAPQGLLALARASFLLVPSWAKCTSSCPALLERPSDNLPATLPVCSSSCLGFNLLPVGRKSSSPNPYVAVTAACRLSPSVPDPVSPSLPLCWDCTSV